MDEAESKGEKVCLNICILLIQGDLFPIKVLLTGHIPPGDTTSLPELGQLYLNITKKYQNTIVGILAGHTHFDQFELVSSKEATSKHTTGSYSY